MSDRGIRLRLGAFVILALVLFATMVFMFGSLPGLFKRTVSYVVRFADAPGLAIGAPVRRSGVKIGEVRDVTLDEETGIVRVTLAIDAQYRIRRSEQATINVGLLGSDAGIDFIPRVAAEGEPVNRDPIDPGAELVGVRAATVSSLLRGASEVVPTSQEALNDIRKSAARLEKFVARLEKSIPLAEETLREYRDLAKSANRQIPEVQKTNLEAREFLRTAREMLPDAQKTMEEYRLVAQEVRRLFPELQKTGREVQEAARVVREFVPTAEKTFDEIRELASDARKTVAEVNKLVPTVRSGVEDVASAARQAQRTLEDIDRVVLENKETVRASLQKLDKAMDQTLKLLNDDNVRNVERSLKNLATVSDDFPRLSKNTEATLSEARDTLRRLAATLEKADASIVDLGKITGPFSTRSERISRNIDEALEKSNAVLTDIRSLMKVLDRADGTLRRILTDPSLYNNLDRAVMSINRLFPQVDQILKDVGVFADKIARHPERLGVGGAVRPDDGLKGPPTPPILPRGLVVPPLK
jgi:phospholipid/cholesterol/gamma-HCH transport system substrate-binding protein